MFRVYVKKVDDRFFHSNERKDRFKSKEFIKKTVTTAFGYVTFERRKYVDKKTGATTLMKKLDLSGTDGFLRS